MKALFTTLAMLAVLSTSAFAQKKKTTVRTAPAAAATPAPTYSYSGGSSSSSSGPNWSVAASLGSVDGTFLIGPSVYAEWPSTLDGHNVSWGAQSGIQFGSGFWTIPIMATGKMHFASSGQIKPYVALGIGVSITHASVDIPAIPPFTTASSVSDTAVKFALLARPGINFGEGEKLFAELPLGTLGGGFAILPTFGYHF